MSIIQLPRRQRLGEQPRQKVSETLSHYKARCGGVTGDICSSRSPGLGSRGNLDSSKGEGRFGRCLGVAFGD
jgi:hypothetical protein